MTPGAPYIGFLGGPAFFGRAVASPAPNLVAAAMGVGVANLGAMAFAPRALAGDSGIHDVLNGAEVVVVEATGIANVSNRFYRVHPRRNDRVICATPVLQAICPDLEFVDTHFTGHLLQMIAATKRDRAEVVLEAVKASWVAAMVDLLAEIERPKLLVSIGHRALPHISRSTMRGAPRFLDQLMLDTVGALADDVLEVVVPEALWTDYAGMGSLEVAAARAQDLPGAAFHAYLARALGPAIQDLRLAAAERGERQQKTAPETDAVLRA